MPAVPDAVHDDGPGIGAGAVVERMTGIEPATFTLAR